MLALCFAAETGDSRTTIVHDFYNKYTIAYTAAAEHLLAVHYILDSLEASACTCKHPRSIGTTLLMKL